MSGMACTRPPEGGTPYSEAASWWCRHFSIHCHIYRLVNSFWSRLYDNFKDRRYGILFFGTLALVFGFLIVGVFICEAAQAYELEKYLTAAAVGAGLLFMVWVGRGIVQMRVRKYERLRFPPLSRDEMQKARSKLVKKREPRRL